MSDRHKNRVVKNGKTYSDWVGTDNPHDEKVKDTLDGDSFGECQTPWVQRPVTDVEYDQIDALYDLHARLKGRQKQILKLLLEGETNQSTIAKVLNMKQSNVNKAVQEIRKKALQQ